MANKGYRERCSPASAQAGIWNKWKTAIAGKDVGGKLGFLSKLNAQTTSQSYSLEDTHPSGLKQAHRKAC